MQQIVYTSPTTSSLVEGGSLQLTVVVVFDDDGMMDHRSTGRKMVADILAGRYRSYELYGIQIFNLSEQKKK